MKPNDKYKAITKYYILTYFPKDIEVQITIINKRDDFRCTGVVNGKVVDEVFGYPYLDCLKIQYDESIN